MSVEYEGPEGRVEREPDLGELRRLIVELPADYWTAGCGGAILQHDSGSRMLVLPNLEHGIYLNLFPDARETEDVWLSLADRNALDTTAECSDEWYASVGLFLPPESAWWAIEDFCTSGGKSDRVEWIRPEELPEGGNW